MYLWCVHLFSLFSWPQVGQNPCRCFIYGSLPCTVSPSRLSLSKQLTSCAVDMNHLRQSDEPLPSAHYAHIHRHTVIRIMRKQTKPERNHTQCCRSVVVNDQAMISYWSMLCLGPGSREVIWWKQKTTVCRLFSSYLQGSHTVFEWSPCSPSLFFCYSLKTALSVPERGFVLCVVLGCHC